MSMLNLRNRIGKLPVERVALVEYRMRPALGFSDCLILEVARKAGHLPLGTFDRELGKLSGAQKLG